MIRVVCTVQAINVKTASIKMSARWVWEIRPDFRRGNHFMNLVSFCDGCETLVDPAF